MTTPTPTPGAASELLSLEQIEAIKQDAERWIAAVAADGSMAGAAAQAIRNIIAGLTFIATPPAPVTEGAQREEWLLDASDKLADWCNRAGDALRDMMAAYERRIRTDCTPEQIEKKPWECREYIVARDVLDKKPAWVVTIPAKAEGAQREAVDSLALVEKIIAMWHEKYPQADAIDINWLRSAGVVRLPEKAPPPPDRAQPERAESELAFDPRMLGYELDGVIMDVELAGKFDDVCLRTVKRVRSALARAAAQAPPTAARGGVTDDMVVAAVRAYEANSGEMSTLHDMRVALEAADRARKQSPVATQPVYPTPVAAYRDVTLEDIDVLNLAVDKWMTTEVGFTCDDKNFSLKEAHFRRRMFAALRSIGAVIRNTGAGPDESQEDDRG